MIPRVLIIVLGVWITSCTLDGNKKVDAEELTFNTTDDSEIFFKNLRQFYYEREELSDAGLTLWRIKERDTSETYPVLNILIAWNWQLDKAYVMLEPNQLLGESFEVTIKCTDQEVQRYTISELSVRAQTTMAARIYNALLDNCKINVPGEGKRAALFHTEDQRESFRKTMADYLRLVRYYR